MKKLLISLFITFMFTVPVSGSIAYAQLDPLKPACDSAQNKADIQELCDTSASPNDPTSKENGVIVTAANLLALAAGIIAVVVIVYAGITMMLSSGDSAKITSSRNTIIYTVVGLFVVLLARTIVVFILDRLIN